MSREILFSVTSEDCDWDYIRGSGKGGQKRNKTSNAVRCTHRASGAVGYAEDTRSQGQNKILAFTRMASSQKFKNWHKLEVARRTGVEKQIQEDVDLLMRPHNIRVEVQKNGRWVLESEIDGRSSTNETD